MESLRKADDFRCRLVRGYCVTFYKSVESMNSFQPQPIFIDVPIEKKCSVVKRKSRMEEDTSERHQQNQQQQQQNIYIPALKSFVNISYCTPISEVFTLNEPSETEPSETEAELNALLHDIQVCEENEICIEQEQKQQQENEKKEEEEQQQQQQQQQKQVNDEGEEKEREQLATEELEEEREEAILNTPDDDDDECWEDIEGNKLF